MKKCNICGHENLDNAFFCEKCAYRFNDVVVSDNNLEKEQVREEYYESIEKGNKMADWAILCWFYYPIMMFVDEIFCNLFFGTFLEDFASYLLLLSPIASLVGLFLMISGRIKYPDNTRLKAVMWTIIVTGVAFIILFCYVLISCGRIIESWTLW